MKNPPSIKAIKTANYMMNDRPVAALSIATQRSLHKSVLLAILLRTRKAHLAAELIIQWYLTKIDQRKIHSSHSSHNSAVCYAHLYRI